MIVNCASRMGTKYIAQGAIIKLVVLASALSLWSTTAFATVITVNGSYTVSQSGATGNKPTITDDLASSFSLPLTVGTPSSVTNFISVTPAGSSGTSNHIATDTLTVTFSFSSPTGATGNLVETGTYTANYAGSL